MLLYYITDRRGFNGTATEQQLAVLRRIAAAARAGVDYVQLREKDLPSRELEVLARDAVHAVRENSQTTGLLINGRADIALAVGADGVHLPAGELAASEVRALCAGSSNKMLFGASAHSVSEVELAKSHGADFAVLAPIFEKVSAGVQGIGLDVLRSACAGQAVPGNTEAAPASVFPVLALGGITLANAADCIAAGAAGVAGIRLFQTGDLADTVRQLRSMRCR